ncbi:MAG: DUF1223 domain-containing protein [Chthoniobacterales bacterium]
MKTPLLLLLLLAAPGVKVSAVETRFQSGPEQTSLVELYTSEGCSSCPPAEASLSRLKNDSGLWKQFVPLAFHVDYWDRLGWRDRFSSKAWTERQSRYAALWQNESVYTPAVVLNGREERAWSSRRLGQPNDTPAGVLSVATSDGKTFQVTFRPSPGATAPYEAHLALLASGLSNKIKAGENEGRNLAHDFVVVDLQKADLKSESGSATARLTTGATAEPGARKAVAVWVTRRGELPPLQATGGWLP